MAKAKEAKVEAPAVEQDNTVLGIFDGMLESVGEMFLGTSEAKLDNTGKKEVEDALDDDSRTKGKVADNGNGRTENQSITFNLGDLFRKSKSKQSPPATEKKGKASGEQEPSDE